MQPSYVAVPVDTITFLALASFLEENGSSEDPVKVVTMAIDYWIDNASWKDDFIPMGAKSGRGFKWKELFLPSGSKIRMKYKGVYHYAEIVEDELVHDGVKTSPSQFAFTVTQTSRNAWRDLEIRRPGDREWALAAALRSKRSG